MADLEYDIKSDGTEDYTTIGGCNAAVAKNIVTSTQTVLIRVHDNLTETTQDLTNGWTANSTYNVTIQANAGAEIEGSFNTTGKAAVSRSGAWASAFNLTADGTLLKGIYFTNSSSNGRYTLDVKLGALDVIVEDCVIDLDTSQDLRALTNTENATEYRKCLFRCVGGQGAYPSSKSAVFRNCGFVESSVGAYSSGGYFELHNCFTMDCSTEYDGSFDSGSSYNAGETATAGDIPGGNSVTGLTSADFEDVSADDYRAKSGGKLDGAGTSQSSYFTVDAFGTTISSWPIGLNEPSGGGGTNYTLSADNGGFTLTGSAANLLYDRLLSANSGSFTLTGTAAGLSYGRVLAAESGTFSLTGSSVGLFAGRALAAGSGSFSFNGTDVGLIYSRHLAAETGSYTLTGASVSLLHDKILSTDSGTFLLTGQDVTLTYASGYHLAADPASFVLVGADAGLIHDKVLAAVSGTYALTGQDAGLYYDRALSAESASFTLNGQDVSLFHHKVLSAESGSFTFTGSSAALTWSGYVPPATPTKRTLTINSVGRALTINSSNRLLTIN